MEITGYKIREALRRLTLRRDTAASQFKPSLHTFEGEKKPAPDEVIERVERTESAIAQLQVVQMRYNLAVHVDVPGEGRLTLAHCIKRIGGLARIEKSWRSAATVKEDRYALDNGLSRDKGTERAVRQISVDDASIRAERFDQRLATLREIIAVGNAHKVDMEDLDASLFE